MFEHQKLYNLWRAYIIQIPKMGELIDYLEKKGHEDIPSYSEFHKEITFNHYLELVQQNPLIIRNAHQRLRDAIISSGCETSKGLGGKEVLRYKLFNDPFEDGEDAIYGLDGDLMKLVEVFDAAARSYGLEKKIIILNGPVGTSKSTIARLLRRGLEVYTKEKKGELYTLAWKNNNTLESCPIHEEPLKLIGKSIRKEILDKLNDTLKRDFSILDIHGNETKDVYRLRVDGDPCPFCRKLYVDFLKEYNGDWFKMLSEKTVIKRICFSELDRVGIATFQPKDEKSQDSTELTGDVSWSKLPKYGSESDPRAFNFEGVLEIGNRGLVEFIEIFKLNKEFLYDLLGVAQEHNIQPRKINLIDVDLVVIGHTNQPEVKKIQDDKYMEALKDRTISIPIPYVRYLDAETKIYQKNKFQGLHIMPHTIKLASIWSILTRLSGAKEELKDKEKKEAQQLSLMQRLRLYNGEIVERFSNEQIEEVIKDAPKEEGMNGISPRYVQECQSKVAVAVGVKDKCINPFLLLRALKENLRDNLLIENVEKDHYAGLLELVEEELKIAIQKDIRQIVLNDPDALENLCNNYLENAKVYIQKGTIKNKYTGKKEEPNEVLMRSIEEKIDIPENRKDNFRREVINYVGALAIEGKKFDYTSSERLKKALEDRLFEDRKVTFRDYTAIIVSRDKGKLDKKEQEKLTDIVENLKRLGYCEHCADAAITFYCGILKDK